MKYTEDALEKITGRSAVIGIVGLGYVGLPLVLGFVARGFRVIGLDIDESKVKALKAGESYIEHIPGEPIQEAVGKGHLSLIHI